VSVVTVSYLALNYFLLEVLFGRCYVTVHRPSTWLPEKQTSYFFVITKIAFFIITLSIIIAASTLITRRCLCNIAWLWRHF